MALNREAMSD